MRKFCKASILRILHHADVGLQACTRRCEGAIAVEFALIMPILITLVIGTVSIVQLIRANIVFAAAASTMGEITAAQTTVTAGVAGITGDYCKGAQFTMFGYNTASLAMAIASVTNTNGSIAQDWENDTSCPTTAVPFGTGATSSAVTLGTPLVPTAGDSVIIVRAAYVYTPLFNLIIGKPVTLGTIVYSRPRNYTVSCSSGC